MNKRPIENALRACVFCWFACSVSNLPSRRHPTHHMKTSHAYVVPPNIARVVIGQEKYLGGRRVTGSERTNELPGTQHFTCTAV